MYDAEADARLLLERHGFTLHDVPGAERLAEAVLGRGCIKVVPARVLRPFRAELARLGGRWTICLPADAGPIEAAFSVFHELGHYCLGARAHGDPGLEAACDSIAAGLACPRGAFRSAMERHGEDWPTIAAAFGASCSTVALRFGEVIGVPLALVAPEKLRVRGDARGWHAEAEVLRLSRARKLPPEIRRSRISDSSKRVLLLEDGGWFALPRK